MKLYTDGIKLSTFTDTIGKSIEVVFHMLPCSMQRDIQMHSLMVDC